MVVRVTNSCGIFEMNTQEEKRLKKAEQREFETKLIMEVKSHICLYAKDHPAYSNKNQRQSAWEDISSILGKSAEECQKKWTSLRDSFRSYFRMDTNVPSGSAAAASVKWIHFQSLTFLIPYVKVPADDCGNLNIELDPVMEVSPSMDLNDVLNVDIVEESPSPIASGSKKRKGKLNDETLERVLNTIENVQNKRRPIEIFFDSVAQQIEHFDVHRQINFQRRILEILAEELAADP